MEVLVTQLREQSSDLRALRNQLVTVALGELHEVRIAQLRLPESLACYCWYWSVRYRPNGEKSCKKSCTHKDLPNYTVQPWSEMRFPSVPSMFSWKPASYGECVNGLAGPPQIAELLWLLKFGDPDRHTPTL